MPSRILYTVFLTVFLCTMGAAQVDTPAVAADSSFAKLSISYLAPQSAEVYLAWIPSNHPLDVAAGWMAETLISDSLLLTPMVAEGDTFRLSLLIPAKTQLYYCFWTSRNTSGHYTDFWDTSAGANLTVGKAPSPIFKRAVYDVPAAQAGNRVLSLAWLPALAVFFLYCLLWTLGKRKAPRVTATPAGLVASLGFSLALLHLPLRLEILGLRPRQLARFEYLNQLLAAAVPDLLVVSGITFLFLFLVFLARQRPRIARLLSYLFAALALLLLFTAIVNVETVRQLGGPFTYQWLYYADFLQGAAAHTALIANTSVLQALQVVLYCSLLPSLAAVFRKSWLLGTGGAKNLTFVISVGLGALLVLALLLKQYSPPNAKRGTTENAVWAFAASVVQTTRTASFFTQELLPEEAFTGEILDSTASHFGTLNSPSAVKNLVVIVLESAGARYLDDYEGKYQITPNLRRYHEQALIFTDAYATAPSSNRTLVSLTSGIYPNPSYRSLTEESPDLVFPSLPAVLNDRGYRTSFFSSSDWNWQKSDRFLEYRDFDQIEDYADITCARQYRFDEVIYPESGGIDDACIADRFINWLGEVPDQAFASVLWTVQGHYPYYFTGKEIDYGVNNFSFNRYLNAIRHDDEMIGEVLDHLRMRGLDSTTLVVVVGDHGEAFGQHGQTGHAGGIYEESLRVPLYFINPTLFQGGREDDLAVIKDVPTTVLGLLGVPVPATWQGRDLMTTNAHEVFSFAPWTAAYFGYRNHRFKYIFNESKDELEVYDLINDPMETNNLSDEHPQDSIVFVQRRVAAWAQYQRAFIADITRDE